MAQSSYSNNSRLTTHEDELPGGGGSTHPTWTLEECLRGYQTANERYWTEHGLSMAHSSSATGQSATTALMAQTAWSAAQGVAYEVLPQREYVAKRQFQPRPSIVFRTASEPFMRLADALSGNVASLLGRDEAVFSQEHLTQKQSLRLEIVGSRSYERQINVRSPAYSSTSITKGKLAEKIAREIFEYLSRYQVGPLVTPGVVIGHGTSDFGRLVLLELRHVSKSSWQPTLGVLRSS